MISLTNVSKRYPGARVLGPITGEILEGGVTALIGPNGAGKSTLLTIIGRLLDPSSGTVTVGGMDVQATKSAELAKHLSILRQENSLSTRLTVRELVGFGRFPHSRGRLRPEDHAQVTKALEFLGMDEFSHRFLDELSGGQRQRAFVAMILAQDTRYVLLDEPLNNLDMRHAVLMMRQLRRASDELGKTVVIVVHDVNFAAAYADRVIALRDGIIAHQGTIETVMTSEVLSDVFETPVLVQQVAGQRTAVVLK